MRYLDEIVNNRRRYLDNSESVSAPGRISSRCVRSRPHRWGRGWAGDRRPRRYCSGPLDRAQCSQWRTVEWSGGEVRPVASRVRLGLISILWIPHSCRQRCTEVYSVQCSLSVPTVLPQSTAFTFLVGLTLHCTLKPALNSTNCLGNKR